MNNLLAAQAEVERLELLMLQGGELAVAELRPALEWARFRRQQLEWRPPSLLRGKPVEMVGGRYRRVP